jgi:phosphotransferase system HPr (HPr) family protein
LARETRTGAGNARDYDCEQAWFPCPSGREFVRKANSFRSEIWLTRNGERFSATSLMDILRGQFECGATATLEAFGTDAQAAVDALTQVLIHIRDQEAGH